ncbi:cytochrome b-c1 complex subunit 6, mitochondrial-like [Chironomus tepperi]|uniref:cytochrome b-c1 complex subunit 6, mitochondrial-like n=1 Tax=Chironomus tepperi TaxID=113505 RepID=UPI00391FC29B
MALNFFKSLIPKVNAQEEDLIDPQTVLREKCQQEHHTANLYKRYQECNSRVNSKSKTAETCVEELFDYLHHLDHCVSKTLMNHLK